MKNVTAHILSLVMFFSSFSLGHAADFGDAAKPYWRAHGTLMVIAWCVVFPMGALIAVYRDKFGKNGQFFKNSDSFFAPHRFCQVFGIVLNIIAVGLAARGCYLEYGTGNPFDEIIWDFEPSLYPWNRHVKWGISVFILLFIQSVLGNVHHWIKHAHDRKVDNGETNTPWKRWIVPSWAHVILGVLILFVAYLTIIQGLQIYVTIYYNVSSPPNGAIRFGYAVVGISGFLFVGLYILGKFRRDLSSSTKPDDGENKV